MSFSGVDALKEASKAPSFEQYSTQVQQVKIKGNEDKKVNKGKFPKET